MFTVMNCYSQKLFVPFKLGTTVFLKCLMSIHLCCWHLLWVDVGIRSVPLGEKKGDTPHLEPVSRKSIGGTKENGFEFLV